MSTKKTCEERIEVELEREMDRIRDASGWKGYCSSCGHEWADREDTPDVCPECESDDIYEEEEKYDVLEVSRLHLVYRIGLSWGGPADGFYVYVDPEDKTISRIEYYFQDWWGGATRELRGNDFNDAKELFENLFYFGD